MEAALASGQRSLQRLWQQAAEAGVAQLIELDDTRRAFFSNMNSPADLQEAQAISSDTLVLLTRLTDGQAQEAGDYVAREEPLEIRVEGRSVAVVMRTPGHDRELAAGFLVSEGVVQRPRDILEISQCPSVGDAKGNIVDVLLGGATVDWATLTRHVFSASSCGLCGKTSIDAIFQRFAPVQATWKVSPKLIASLPDKLRGEQATFSKTGGLHACALFDLSGHLVVVREDVGRHNALDKVLGYGLLHGLLPFQQHILLLSGRVSFEMIQKALAGGIAIVAAISAPSSLAVEFAQEAGQTLIGFLRGQTMNVYSHRHRIED
jgi:FdhD protein